MNITEIAVSELKPYPKNTKKHDETQITNVAQSIKDYGFVQPVVIDKNNEVVIGHCRLLAAKQLGMETVPCVSVDELTEEQVKALRIVDNKTNESPWELDFLADELAEIDLGEFDFDFGLEPKEQKENPYTDKIKIPQYEVKGETPDVCELVDRDKQIDLIAEIDRSSISDSEKEFLRMAAYRHIVFDYRKIAEYYANASEEMQELMERSALVIIDYEDAIANGYVRLSERLRKLRENNA
jgi:F0F1-type ATP synthase delta subunit